MPPPPNEACRHDKQEKQGKQDKQDRQGQQDRQDKQDKQDSSKTSKTSKTGALGTPGHSLEPKALFPTPSAGPSSPQLSQTRCIFQLWQIHCHFPHPAPNLRLAPRYPRPRPCSFALFCLLRQRLRWQRYPRPALEVQQRLRFHLCLSALSAQPLPLERRTSPPRSTVSRRSATALSPAKQTSRTGQPFGVASSSRPRHEIVSASNSFGIIGRFLHHHNHHHSHSHSLKLDADPTVRYSTAYYPRMVVWFALLSHAILHVPYSKLTQAVSFGNLTTRGLSLCTICILCIVSCAERLSNELQQLRSAHLSHGEPDG